MIIVQKLKKLSLFIIFIINSKWLEIIWKLLGDQQFTDHFNLIIRIFYLKFGELMENLKNHVFNFYVNHVDFIEYQKMRIVACTHFVVSEWRQIWLYQFESHWWDHLREIFRFFMEFTKCFYLNNHNQHIA